MLAYALPIGEGKLALWTPAPRLCWGELDGLETLTVLSPRDDLDIARIASLSHDYIFRTTTRGTTKFNTFSRVKHLMLWGVIWLVGMNRGVLEDTIGGIYLLLGLPMFMGLTEMVLRQTYYKVFSKFKDLTYSPEVNIVLSPRLARLQIVYENKGRVAALRRLDELGLSHLREFYRRCAWSERWRVGPPKGHGIIC